MSDDTPQHSTGPGSRDDDELAESLALDAALAEHPSGAIGRQPASTGPEPAVEGADATVSGDSSHPTGPIEPATDQPDSSAVSLSKRGQHAAAPKRRGKHRKAPWWELPALVLLAIVIAILVKSFVVQPFYIPSQSMEKTLHGCPGCSGDRILVNKVIYDFRDPHPGDIVVFHAPPGWNDEPASTPPSNPVLRVVRGFGQLIGFVPPDGLVLVKRVIAIGGQSVRGDAAGNVFVRDSSSAPWRELDEKSFVDIDGVDAKAKFGPVTVPKGRLWVMGDHRNESADSRYHCGAGASDGPDNASCDVTAATVPISDVIGKAFVIAWPPSRWRTLGTPTTFEASAAATGALPVAGSAAVVLPVLVLRRRRRRANRRRRGRARPTPAAEDG
jgi:signal peptidase I